jgi:hypothetical protein
MNSHWLQRFLYSPLGRRLSWVVFAILFYLSGEAATIWLLEPQAFNGGWQWFWLFLFPVLLPAFFLLQRFFGCSGDQCQIDVSPATKKKPTDMYYINRPPGC